MYNWTEHNKLKAILSQDPHYSEMPMAHQIKCRPVKFLKWVEFLKNDLNFFNLVDIVFHNEGRSYTFFHYETSQRVLLFLDIKKGETVPSLASLYSNAYWLENEKKLITADDDYALMQIPKVKFNPNRSEAPYLEESYIWHKYDIFSPEVEKQFELLACYDQNKLIDARADIGFHHRKFEVYLQSRHTNEILREIDTINVGIAPTYSIAFAKSLEEMFRIKVPQRAQAVRMIQLELARVAEHLDVTCRVFAHFKSVDLKSLYQFKFKILELLRRLSQVEKNVAVILGGLSIDIPFGWVNEYRIVSEDFLREIEKFHKVIVRNEKVHSVLKQGGVNPKVIIDNGISGPVARAAGINLDLRKSNPFYFYNDVDFDVPVEVGGTAWDRFSVRYHEIVQSMLIINQVVDNLPLGEICSENIEMQFSRNGLLFSSFLESPHGQSGIGLRFNDDSRLDSFRIITPHLGLSQSLSLTLQGINKEHLAPHLASLGINSLEIDR